MALVNINFTVLARAYVLYARALQSRIRGGTFAAPVRPALKSGTAMRTTVKSGTAFAVPAGPSTPPLHQHIYALNQVATLWGRPRQALSIIPGRGMVCVHGHSTHVQYPCSHCESVLQTRSSHASTMLSRESQQTATDKATN